ncbi:unnamed protein product [Phytophthora fragariaefolia]|uniref:Unnamed protein product n=1 Tax=Phytophthora fragariaefolia TaxID=1490495 RepID=A0A9W7D0A4_9STRA|nr:unnamed protein product [Phytophthora fragariaefolia]
MSPSAQGQVSLSQRAVTKFQVSSEQDGQGIVIAESRKSSDGWRISDGEIKLGKSAGRRHDGGCGGPQLQFEDDDARGQGYDEGDEDDEEKEEVDMEYVKSTADLLGEVEELSLQVSQMRTRSEWMMMFAPVAMAQAKWPVLGPELTQPINSTGINQLVEDTVLLLKAMGYRCNSRPNRLILSGWSLARASAELA